MLPFNIIDFGTEEVTGMLDYAGDLVSDLMLLIVVVLGISLGLYVINRILHRD